MDTKAYIESGIIESYVLGLASPDEVAELEQLCAEHTDIQIAVDDFAAMMEAQAFDNAVAPPAAVKGKIMQALAAEFEKEDRETVPVIPMDTADAHPSYNTVAKPLSRYLAAASVILLIASTALNFYFYNSYKNSDTKYQALLTERNSIQASNDVFRTKLSGFEESIRIMQNPDVLKINMAGVKGKEQNLAAVYWDSKSKDVYLLPTKLDALPGDKQYQLWALVDGVPVDAGVMENCDGLCRMGKKIQRAQAFAITVEKKGGSATPTLPAMVVMGNI